MTRLIYIKPMSDTRALALLRVSIRIWAYDLYLGKNMGCILKAHDGGSFCSCPSRSLAVPRLARSPAPRHPISTFPVPQSSLLNSSGRSVGLLSSSVIALVSSCQVICLIFSVSLFLCFSHPNVCCALSVDITSPIGPNSYTGSFMRRWV